ncbi:MAG: metallophosphoesterase [Anaerolineales bacterium]
MGPMFFGPLRNVIGQIPLIPVRGNHEGHEQMRMFYRWPTGKASFSFEIGPVHLTCMDYNKSGKALPGWVDRDLASARTPWKIAVCHYPAYNNIAAHDLGRQVTWKRNTIVPLFRKHKLDLFVGAHVHLYERLFPLRPDKEPSGHPITYLVSGGGAADLFSSRDHPYLAARKTALHFLVVRATAETLSVQAIDKNGRTFDQFIIPKRNGRHDPEYLALAKPEGPIAIETELVRQLSGKLDVLPSKTVPGQLNLSLKLSSIIDEPVAVEIVVAPVSAGSYRLDPPVKGIVLPGAPFEPILKIYSKTEDVRGTSPIRPKLRLACRFRYKTFEGTSTGAPIGRK